MDSFYKSFVKFKILDRKRRKRRNLRWEYLLYEHENLESPNSLNLTP